MTEDFKAINWHRIANRVDYSAWSRMNDFVWEPERIPINKDQKEFQRLPHAKQRTVLRAFGALAFLSTLQVKYGDDAVKQDSVTSQEFAVWSALSYQEATANKSYSNVIENLAAPDRIDSYFAWADQQESLQALARLIVALYQKGKPFEKKIALSFMEMCLYHIGFYAPLYLFGRGKLRRTTEVVKYAMRTTTFNAMYPGVKFRLESQKTSAEQQAQIERWTKDLAAKLKQEGSKLIHVLYDDVGWTQEASKYFQYTLNKNFLNLGYAMPYPTQIQDLNEQIQQGVIKSAADQDFFFYSNRNTLTKYRADK